MGINTYDPTGRKDDAKQDTLDNIYQGIKKLLLSDEDDFVMQNEIADVSLEDIEEYLYSIVNHQSIDIKLGRLTPVVINNEDLFYPLCDRLHIGGERPHEIKIYFLESSDDMITIIPIRTADSIITIPIEHSENSPEEIRALWHNIHAKSNLDNIIDGRDLRKGW